MSRNSTYFGADGLGRTKPVVDPSRNNVVGGHTMLKLPNLGFLLYGHPDQHGGPNVPLPVLVSIENDTYVFVCEEIVKADSGITPIAFTDPTFATAEAAKVPRPLRIMSANLMKDELGIPRAFDRMDAAGDPPPKIVVEN